MATSQQDFDVFLSHNSKDKPLVRELATALKERGLRVWLDEWELTPGQPWQVELEAIIRTTKSAAVLVGADGLGPWEHPEMRACLSQIAQRKLPVIPVLLPNAGKQPELPLFLQEFTWVDLRDGLTDEGIERLKWGITQTKPNECVDSALSEARQSVAEEHPTAVARVPSRVAGCVQMPSRTPSILAAILALILAVTGAWVAYKALTRPPELREDFQTFLNGWKRCKSLDDDSAALTRFLNERNDHRVTWECYILDVDAARREYFIGTTENADFRDRALATFSESGGFEEIPSNKHRTIEGVLFADELDVRLKECRFAPSNE